MACWTWSDTFSISKSVTSGGEGVAAVVLNKPSSFYCIEGMVKQVNGSIAVRKNGKNDKRRKRRASRGYNVCQIRSHSSMCSDWVKRNLADTIPLCISDTFFPFVKGIVSAFPANVSTACIILVSYSQVNSVYLLKRFFDEGECQQGQRQRAGHEGVGLTKSRPPLRKEDKDGECG